MRSLATLGILSLVGAAALFACGDDDSGTPGQGGSAGSGTAGSAGSGGGSGDGGSAGAAGSAGASGAAGSAGSGGDVTADCTGCAVLEVPFTGTAGQVASYQLSLPAPGLDLSNAVVTINVRSYTPSATLTAQITVQNANPPDYPGFYNAPQVALAEATFGAAFAPISLDLGPLPGPTFLGGDAGVGDAGDAGPTADPTVFDKTSVDSINFQLSSTAALDAVVAIDSIVVTNVDGYTGPTFNAGLEGFRLNTYDGSTEPAGTPMPVAQ